MDIISIIIICAVIVGILFFLFGEGINKEGVMWIGVIIVVIALGGGFVYYTIADRKEKEQALEMIEGGAEVYLNGQLVDGTKMDLQYYYVTIKEDSVILTTKDGYMQ